MIGSRAGALGLWLCGIGIAIIVVIRATYIADLSAFLPAHPTPTQQLLVDQLRDGPASRLILIALEGGSATERAHAMQATAAALRRDTQFANVSDGEASAQQGDREFLFKHRYLLSQTVNAQRFSAAGLHEAIAQSIESLSSAAGLLFKSLLPRDPTGELPQVLDQLSNTAAPTVHDGVWVSPDGLRAIAVVQTLATGSDTDAQERAMLAIRQAFETSKPPAQMTLRLTGPGVFAVSARAKIERAAIRLSLISSVLVIALLLSVYRSLPALGLGLLPVASGAVVGIAAVALGFGAVHGITLGFGVTLIGESVDYSIYFFVQSRAANAARAVAGDWQRDWWPTVRLGMLTSVCGFASLLPSGFPGLQQLGLYSISGLIAAGLVTRFVLPALLPANFAVHDVTGLGLRLTALLAPLRRGRGAVIAIGVLSVGALALLIVHAQRGDLWNRELSALSPVSSADLNFDAALRADLGTADVSNVVIVTAEDLEGALRSAERVAEALRPLIEAGVISSLDSPADFLPSRATQERRRSSLPPPAQLQANLKLALKGGDGGALPVRGERLDPFLEDVEATRHAALIAPRDLAGTSLSAAFDSMILHQRERWNALLPLHPPANGNIDFGQVQAALAAAHLNEARILDLKQESDSLYADYLQQALRLSGAGFVLLTLLLAIALRSAMRILRVLAPLILAVLLVTGGLCLAHVQLTILHLVGMLLIVAVGSNYALFFDRRSGPHQDEDAARTLASLGIANASTVIGFGLLSFSQVPVLTALGTTVAPGAFLALIIAALMASEPAGDELAHA